MDEANGDIVHLVKSAAKRAGCHEKTLLKALRRGELIGYQRSGTNGTWRIFQGDLDRWIRGEQPAHKTKVAS